MLGEVQHNHKFYDPVDEYMEQPCLNTGITEFSKGCFEPVAGYVEKLDTVNDWLWLCDGKKVPYHDLCQVAIQYPFLSSMRSNCSYGITRLISFTGSQKSLDWAIIVM